MDTFDKIQTIDAAYPDTSKAAIKTTKEGNQSIKMQYPCGCYIMRHMFATPSTHPDLEVRERNTVNRCYYAELCKQHEKM